MVQGRFRWASGAGTSAVSAGRAAVAVLDRHRRGEGAATTARIDRAISKAAEHLLGLQHRDGFWWGELEANCAVTAEYLLLTYFMDVPNRKRWRKIVNYLEKKQLEDGGWSIWYGGPGDLSIAIECYFAIRLAGVPYDAPVLVKARRFILERGGVPNARVFTKLWLALFGLWKWEDLPTLPVEIMHLPAWFPFSVYDFASWARGTIIPCSILLTKKSHCAVPESARLDELHPAGRETTERQPSRNGTRLSLEAVFRAVARGARLLERRPAVIVRRPLRESALKKAERWILDHQEADGSWGGIQAPWVYSLMALRTMGYGNGHPVIRKGLEGFEGFARETRDTFHIDSCLSPVWDTCLAVVALQDAGISPEEPSMVRAARWLLGKQILEQGGDWQVRRPRVRPGGWAFEFTNDTYPDTDDTALALIALHRMDWGDEPRVRLALDRGLGWLEGMQSRNGGWGAFDADNDKRWVEAIPFCDFGEVTDPPTEDVTAHALEAMGRMGFDASRPAVRAGLQYLRETQQSDGSWWGRWGVNCIYGVGAVLPALKWVGEDMDQLYIRRAVDWLFRHQHGDGGWGESVESYFDPTLRGQGPSTRSQTAWALIGLIAAGHAGAEGTKRGVDYLVCTQQADGSWAEPEFTGTGFPGDFMINYHLYRLYWPLLALSQYRRCSTHES